jgi:putative flippase GtrA
MKIYFVILRFALSSLFATLIDVSIFTICYKFLTTNVLIDISVGRVVSSTANFAVNRSLVFDDTKGVTAKLIKYYLLVVFLMLLSYACIKILSSRFGLHPVLAKILAETMLFFASFSIQRDFIFVDKDQL